MKVVHINGFCLYCFSYFSLDDYHAPTFGTTITKTNKTRLILKKSSKHSQASVIMMTYIIMIMILRRFKSHKNYVMSVSSNLVMILRKEGNFLTQIGTKYINILH